MLTSVSPLLNIQHAPKIRRTGSGKSNSLLRCINSHGFSNLVLKQLHSFGVSLL